MVPRAPPGVTARAGGVRALLQELARRRPPASVLQAAEVIGCGFLQFLCFLEFRTSLAALPVLPVTRPFQACGSTCMKRFPGVTPGAPSAFFLTDKRRFSGMEREWLSSIGGDARAVTVRERHTTTARGRRSPAGGPRADGPPHCVDVRRVALTPELLVPRVPWP